MPVRQELQAQLVEQYPLLPKLLSSSCSFCSKALLARQIRT